MTLVWGVPAGRRRRDRHGRARAGSRSTSAPIATSRFTLLAPDAYRGDYLEVALYDGTGDELARESLYEDDGED